MIILPARYAQIRWDEEHAQQWVHETFTWTDRDSYLAWVAAWKATLKQQIEEIRAMKAIRRDKTKSTEERNGANAARQAFRIECANLFLLRKMAKELSKTQRERRLAA